MEIQKYHLPNLIAIAKLIWPKSVSNCPRIGTVGSNKGLCADTSKSPAALQYIYNFFFTPQKTALLRKSKAKT